MPSSGDLPNPGIKPRSSALWVDSLPCEPPGKPKTTGVGSLFLLQGIFPTQDSNWGLLHCRWILYQLSYHGNSDKSIFLCKKQNKTKNLMEFQEEPKVFWFNLGLFYFYEKWMHLYLKGLSGCHYVQFVHPSSETFSWTIAFVCLLLRGVWAISLDWKKRREKPLLHVHFKTVFLPDWFCSQNKHIAAGGCESEVQLKGEKSMIHFKEK